ncbi:MAG: glycosyltransferase [Candidatus Adiutrix sp.]|nr:glycosyltransferase [Candidatus Adiutrix sp.]
MARSLSQTIAAWRRRLWRRCFFWAVPHLEYKPWPFFCFRREKIGFSAYSVVSAVYNSALYLDDFFRSLTRQSLDFRRHIQLVMVNDGSTDGSAAVIEKWRKRYPDNITQLRKENGGAGSARNAGLPLARHPWVTFIDSDDFVHPDYFLQVDEALKARRSRRVTLMACGRVQYLEAAQRFRNAWSGLTISAGRDLKEHPHNDLEDDLCLVTNSAFFLKEEIERQSLRFSEANWPSCEDGDFVLRYVDGSAEGRVLFYGRPKYYHRRRRLKNSLCDTAVNKKEFYLDRLEGAFERLLADLAAKHGRAPAYAQRAVFCHLAQTWRDAAGRPENLDCLSPAEKMSFLNLSRAISARLDDELILNSDFPAALGLSASPDYRRLFLKHFKNAGSARPDDLSAIISDLRMARQATPAG